MEKFGIPYKKIVASTISPIKKINSHFFDILRRKISVFLRQSAKVQHMGTKVKTTPDGRKTVRGCLFDFILCDKAL